VLLDAMGTLLSLPAPWPALVRSLAARDVLVSDQQAERAFRAEMGYYRAHHDEGRDAATLADLRRRCVEVLRAELPAAARELPTAELTPMMLGALRFRAYPEAAGVLRALRARGLKLAVVSNWDVSLPEALRRTGLDSLVDAVITSATVGASKPSPAIFAAALETVGAVAAEALHVGDSVAHDIQGAVRAGIAPVLVRRGGPPAGLPRDGDVPAGVPVIAALDELPRLAA
jgi:putative hydrolase of the HAD superfamily